MIKEYQLNEISGLGIYGRVQKRADGYTFFWTGSTLEFQVTGGELAVEIEVSEDTINPWICIYQNDHLQQRRILEKGIQKVLIYSGMNYKEPKTIKIIKDTPAMLDNGVFEGASFYTIRKIYTDGSFSPIPRKKMKIELIGDSITSGEGLFGYPGLITEDLWFFTAQLEYHYGMRVAKELDADIRIVTQAGWGIYIGYNNVPANNMPSIYEKVCGVVKANSAIEYGAQEDYDFSSWQPDLVIVNLGTNDAAAFSNPGYSDPVSGTFSKMRKDAQGIFNEEDREKIRQAAVRFLRMLREHNPNAPILWAYGMMKNEIEEDIIKAIELVGDPKIHYLSLPDTLEGEFGSVDHPGIPSHRKSADALLQVISKIL